ncbi:hypothetical protein BKA82DRAFT_17603 [Pisolithus tinctorius]|uniref:Phosphoglycerate mutase family protein n=1 Tax=Pisolithus tinctorius Marx 270 TaxID=870435 RepID=A0A0C3PKH4_PISTI|nr:hypothetical protein BKA82DRAFT_17603 [Pisolithus tinctorius]KIO14740.1 hypothetical protein M404DRAFT_17603 [Pisolithus tinctorius Marx 270]
MGILDVFSSHEDSYNQYNETGNHHKASTSHELIAGAAAYEAAKAYEDHVARNGQPDSHAKAKEILAGLAGAFVDREVETKGLDFVDRERAKRHARTQIDEQFTENVYVEGNY